MGVTCHKFQEKTCDTLELILKSSSRVHGLAYVSLTRFRTENGNGFSYPLQPTDTYVDPNVLLERTRLREMKPRKGLLSLLESDRKKYFS